MSYRQTISPRPGPGAYDGNHNATLANRSTTFHGHAKVLHAKSQAAEAVAKLMERRSMLDGRLKLLKDHLTKVDAEHGGGARDTIQAEMYRVKQLRESTMQTLKQARGLLDKELQKNTPSGLHISKALDTDRAQTAPFTFTSNKFKHADEKWMDEQKRPGPQRYIDKTITFGQDGRSIRFPQDRRTVGLGMSHTKSQAAMKHDKQGYPYFADVDQPGPGAHAPHNFGPPFSYPRVARGKNLANSKMTRGTDM